MGKWGDSQRQRQGLLSFWQADLPHHRVNHVSPTRMAGNGAAWRADPATTRKVARKISGASGRFNCFCLVQSLFLLLSFHQGVRLVFKEAKW